MMTLYLIGVIVGYGIWPKFHSSFGPKGMPLSCLIPSERNMQTETILVSNRSSFQRSPHTCFSVLYKKPLEARPCTAAFDTSTGEIARKLDFVM